MIQFFQQFGCCIPSHGILSAEDRRAVVSSDAVQSQSSNPRLVEQNTSSTLQHTHLSDASKNARVMGTDQPNANNQGMEHDGHEHRLKRCTAQDVNQTVVAMFQDAQHLNISGNARIMNIGHQLVNYRGNYYPDTLKEFVSFSALHDSSAQDPERCCHPGTRKNVLNSINTWMDHPNTPERILWLHGPAGVGKSAIAQTISYSYDRDKIAATFFFFRTDPLRNDGNRLLPTLAWQLASSIPLVKDLIAFTLEEYPDIPRKTIEIQFDQLIAKPLLTISSGESTSPTSMPVIIIDGLDECSDVKLQERILKIIGNAVADTRFPLRFLISSRPEAHIQDFFDQFKSPTLQIDLAKVEDSFRDIKTYFKSEFARIAVEQQLDPDAWPDLGIIDSLVLKSSGQFVYASTVMKYVGDKYESAIAQLNVVLGLKPCTGRSPFSELDALYIEILQRQPDKSFLKEFLPLLVARSLLIVMRDEEASLHEDDAKLLGFDEKQLYRKLRGMRSLLKFEPSIGVHHRSFLDFLLDSSRSGEYHVSEDFANMQYMQRIVDLLVNAASKAMEQPDSHDDDHFRPRFAKIIKPFFPRIILPFDDLEKILRPLQRIQESLLQLPDMSVPWKPRACNECWTFYIIDDLLLHMAWLSAKMQLRLPKYVGIRPLTAVEEKQNLPELDVNTCLSLLLTHLRSVELLLNEDMIGLTRALIHFDPTETAMKIRSMTDAQNLVELLFCLNKSQCLKSWFGAADHNATRLALAIYGRVPLLPQFLLLNGPDLDYDKNIYKGKPVEIWGDVDNVREQCYDTFVRGILSHVNMGSHLGVCFSNFHMMEVLASPENGTLSQWQRKTKPTISQIQKILFEVASAIQYMHSLGIVLKFGISTDHVFLDTDNHVKMQCICFHPRDYCKGKFNYLNGSYHYSSTLEDNVCSFGNFFDIVADSSTQIVPRESEVPGHVRYLIRRCCAEDPTERPVMDQVVQALESWIPLG